MQKLLLINHDRKRIYDEFNVAVIPGDGIGPEIVREAQKVLDAVGTKLVACLQLHRSGYGRGVN